VPFHVYPSVIKEKGWKKYGNRSEWKKLRSASLLINKILQNKHLDVPAAHFVFHGFLDLYLSDFSIVQLRKRAEQKN
jgi:hypothetical protein